jgi:hypothetical protein
MTTYISHPEECVMILEIDQAFRLQGHLNEEAEKILAQEPRQVILCLTDNSTGDAEVSASMVSHWASILCDTFTEKANRDAPKLSINIETFQHNLKNPDLTDEQKTRLRAGLKYQQGWAGIYGAFIFATKEKRQEQLQVAVLDAVSKHSGHRAVRVVKAMN